MFVSENHDKIKYLKYSTKKGGTFLLTKLTTTIFVLEKKITEVLLFCEETFNKVCFQLNAILYVKFHFPK